MVVICVSYFCLCCICWKKLDILYQKQRKNMNKMDTVLTGQWVSFFTTAGIPSDVSATYALTFAENRIQNDMLLDLNKEYLRDMGITRMGDVIAILRHAKQVHESAARERVLCGAPRVPVAAVPARTQPASPVSRIVERYTRNSPESPPAAGKRKASERVEDLGTNDAEAKKARLIRFKEQARVTANTGTISKTVFARLGSSDIIMPEKVVETPKPVTKPIFARLGSKSAEQVPKPIPVPKDALKYEGILKSKPVAKKVVTVTTSVTSARKIAVGCTMRADETPVSVKEKLANTKPKSVKFSNRVEYKEIEANKNPVAKAAPRFTTVFNKPERRLSMPEAAETSVKTRLGVTNRVATATTKNVNNFTITKSVFNRLGA